MIGLWDKHHTVGVRPFGEAQTYTLAADWLRGHGLVEDWGCGAGYARQFFEDYRGVDGSGTFADLQCDLSSYTSSAPCILMRHVLEHNFGWRKILDNMLSSFTERAVVVNFQNLEADESVRCWEGDIPYIGLPRDDFMRRIQPLLADSIVCGDETCFLLKK